jgi:hypothetical protein
MAAVHYLSGQAALARQVEEVMESCAAPRDVALVFDFDRTLTNGYASPEQVAVEHRIRGGQATVQALHRAAKAGARLFVVTARSAREMILDTMVHSFSSSGTLHEIGELFVSADSAFEQVLVDDAKLARKGHIYATDYRKPAAIKHIFRTLGEHAAVHFFDDFVGNAYDVALASWPPGCVLHVYWWDPFEEERCESMTMVSTSSTDWSYKQEYAGYRRAFGVDDATALPRIQMYLERAKSAAKPGADVGVKPPPPPQKLVADPGKFGALSGLFAAAKSQS